MRVTTIIILALIALNINRIIDYFGNKSYQIFKRKNEIDILDSAVRSKEDTLQLIKDQISESQTTLSILKNNEEEAKIASAQLAKLQVELAAKQESITVAADSLKVLYENQEREKAIYQEKLAKELEELDKNHRLTIE